MTSLYPRYLLPKVHEALQYSPVVLIQGPRQCGKTTLARQVGEAEGHDYISFDNEVHLTRALEDPMGFVADLPEKVILDEVQRVPGLFRSLKLAVDNDRRPGRFILTGSANMLLIPRLSDSLAGRMSILKLRPLAQAEIAGQQSHFLDTLFDAKPRVAGSGKRLGAKLAERIVAGGYPEPLGRPERWRTTWYRDYLDTLVQRDIADMEDIRKLPVLSQLVEVAADQTAQLLNISRLTAPFQISISTIREYTAHLSRVFLLEELRPWHSSQLKRLVKTPKLHFADTGLACALLGLNAERLWADRQRLGQMLETFVFGELQKQASWQEELITFSHYRDTDQMEVDMVLESRGRLVGIEVKSASTITKADFKGLRKLQKAAGPRFAAGILLYDGDTAGSFGPGLHIAPLSTLWGD